MEGVSYAQAVASNNFDPLMMLLEPMLAEIEEEADEVRVDKQGPLSQTIEERTRNCEIYSVIRHEGENYLKTLLETMLVS